MAATSAKAVAPAAAVENRVEFEDINATFTQAHRDARHTKPYGESASVWLKGPEHMSRCVLRGSRPPTSWSTLEKRSERATLHFEPNFSVGYATHE